jgi:hypothetical protein
MPEATLLATYFSNFPIDAKEALAGKAISSLADSMLVSPQTLAHYRHLAHSNDRTSEATLKSWSAKILDRIDAMTDKATQVKENRELHQSIKALKKQAKQIMEMRLHDKEEVPDRPEEAPHQIQRRRNAQVAAQHPQLLLEYTIAENQRRRDNNEPHDFEVQQPPTP